MGHSSCSAAPFRRLSWVALALAVCAAPARAADVSIAGSALLGADEWGYRHEQYGLELARETEASGQHLALRFHRYALTEALDGVLAFSGREPAARIGGHALLDDALWLGAAAGFQGTFDLDGATGELIAAYAIPVVGRTLTPRIELAREPLALSPLPLSLGLNSHRAQAALGWRAETWVAEAGARIDFWEGDTVPDRTRNSARDRIDPNRIATGYGYAITDSEGWLDCGLSAKVTAAERNTLLAAQLVPERRYAWYPASAPPFAWETGLVLRAQSPRGEPVELKLQLTLPLLSQERRRWEQVHATSWGTAPYEAGLDVGWQMLDATRVELQAKLFIKPWESWDVTGPYAYRFASVRLALEQRI